MSLPSKEALALCPYCLAKGRSGDHLTTWQSRSVDYGVATRWTRCESCYAMWREVYDWKEHHYRHAEHWKPKA